MNNFEKFFEMLLDVDMRKAEKGKQFNLMMPDGMKKLIEEDIAEIERVLKIKVTMTTYLLLCTMMVSNYGQNPKKEFYRFKKEGDLRDYIKKNESELQRQWIDYIIKNRKRTF